jgi:hypothetical protein
MACAWAGFAGYGVAMTLSYIVGQRCHPIGYPLRQIGFYTGFAILFTACMMMSRRDLPMWASLTVNTLIVIIFVAIIARREIKEFKL